MGIGTKIVDIISGGLGKGITDIIKERVKDPDLAAQLEADLEKLHLETNRDIQVAVEETHREELKQDDRFVKRTRPQIARQSWYLAIAYVLTSLATQVKPEWATIPLDPVIFGSIVSPALWYMGMRTFDKSRWGRVEDA